MIGPKSMPPTTTVASGRCTWLPIPVENAAGTKPIQADNAVMSMGRMRFSAACRMAWTGDIFCCLNWLK